ncbi:unnamed protein product, partial [Coregonus sp. 'balchen']
PANVDHVDVTEQTQTSVTLQWNKPANGVSSYLLNFGEKEEIHINASEGVTDIHTVSPLTAGTQYGFTLFTVFEGVRSTGFNYTAATAPRNVADVKVTRQTETSLTLQWKKVEGEGITYVLQFNNGTNTTIPVSDTSETVTYTVSSLDAGTKYNFSIFTVFEKLPSNGYNVLTITRPISVDRVNVTRQTETSLTLQWKKVEGEGITYVLQFNNGTNNTIPVSDTSETVTYTVSSLDAGTKYNFSIFTVFEKLPSNGYNVLTITRPLSVDRVNVTRQTETSLTLQWKKVEGEGITYVLQFNNGTNNTIPVSDTSETVTYTVSSLDAGTKYNFSIFTVFEKLPSNGYNVLTITRPISVDRVNVTRQTETSLTLQWKKVEGEGITYVLQFNNGTNNTIPVSDTSETVTYTVSSLDAGTKYNFSIFTVFEKLPSNGYNVLTITRPLSVDRVNVTRQTETSLTLQWKKVEGEGITYVLQFNNGTNNTIPVSDTSETVTYTVSSLDAGTKYNFSIFTVFEKLPSNGYNVLTITRPLSVDRVNVTRQTETSLTLQWKKVEGEGITYVLQFNNGTNTTIPVSDTSETVTYTVSSLDAGTKYNFSIFTVFEKLPSNGYNVLTITREQTETSLTLQWKKVEGEGITYVLQFNNGTNTTIPVSDTSETVTYTVSSLDAGTKYNFSIFTVFEKLPSNGYNVLTITRPLSVDRVNVTRQNETSVTLQWNKVKGEGITYELQFSNGTNNTIPVSDTSEIVTHTVSSLDAGTKYNFSIFTVIEDIRSIGSKLSAVTAPLNVEAVTATESHRTETSVTLEWKRPAYGVSSYVLQFTDKGQIPIPILEETVTHTVQLLDVGKRYDFTLFTVFDGIWSSGESNFTVTKINCAVLPWNVTTSTIEAKIPGLFTSATATNETYSETHDNAGDGKVLFTDLYPGSNYTVSLQYTNYSKDLRQCTHTETVVPPDLTGKCDYLSGGYAFSLSWDAPEGLWTSVEVNVAGKSPQQVKGEQVMEAEITGVQPAQTYQVTLVSISGPRRSIKAFSFSCHTDPR